jgi:hypothetical protein
MNRPVRLALGAALAVAVTVAIAALSRVPYVHAGGEHAVLRLAWRTPGDFVEACRRPTAEELERVPIHMRREEICEGRMLPRRLVVRLDGEVVLEETVEAPGARGDRPLSVFRELPLPPGDHALEVSWATVGDVPPRGDGARRSPVPPRMDVSAALRLEPRDVALVTFDPDRRTLVAVGRGIESTRSW